MSRRAATQKTAARGLAAGFLLAAAAAVVVSCEATRAAAPEPPRVTTLAPFPKRIPLLNNPRELRHDYVYPPAFMRQKLVWTDVEMEWRMRFPSRRYAYAGVVLRDTVDVAGARERARLSFRIRPAQLASYLAIALVDSQTNSTPVMTDLWLMDAGTYAGDDWVTIDIAMTAFPSDGVPVSVDGAADTVERRPFDWSSIRELRFVSGGGRLPPDEITVKNLRIIR